MTLPRGAQEKASQKRAQLRNAPETAIPHEIAPGPRLAQIAARLRACPPTHRGTYLRAVKGSSPTACVQAFCAECCGWDRESVTQCPALACPLWPIRPWRPGP